MVDVRRLEQALRRAVSGEVLRTRFALGQDISAKAARVDESPHVLKHNETFVLFDHFGDVQWVGSGDLGVYLVSSGGTVTPCARCR